MQPAMTLLFVLFLALLDSTCVLCSTSSGSALMMGLSGQSPNVLHGISGVAPVREPVKDPAANIAFDLPDLTVGIETTSGMFQLEAYRSIINDAILHNAIAARTNELSWVSLGRPEIVLTPDSSNPNVTKLFHSTYYGFRTYINMLTLDQRSKLASKARAKYNVNIADDQIVHLVLASFECSLTMYDTNNKKYLLKGTVSNFNEFPLVMDFPASPSCRERKLFTQLINNEETLSHLMFDCTLTSTGKTVMTNVLTISIGQQQHIGLDEKLFGDTKNESASVFVTRDQTSMLSSEMYDMLNIIEDYDMPEEEFSEKFVDGLLDQFEAFKLVDTETVLASISKYGFDVRGDIKPDVIKQELGSILKVQRYSNKSHIIADMEHYKKFINAQTESGRSNGDVAWSPFSAKYSIDFASRNKQEAGAKDKSLEDQLAELNAASKDEAHWEFDGEKVIPKKLNVARFSRAKLGREIKFKRVKIRKIVASFEKKIGLYTRRLSAAVSLLNQVYTHIDQITSRLTSRINLTDIKISGVQSQLNSAISSTSSQINGVQSQLNSAIRSTSSEINGVQSQLNSASSYTSSQINGVQSQLNSVISSTSIQINAVKSTIASLDSVAVRDCVICFDYRSCAHCQESCQSVNSYLSWYTWFSSSASVKIKCRNGNDLRYG